MSIVVCISFVSYNKHNCLHKFYIYSVHIMEKVLYNKNVFYILRECTIVEL